MSYLYRKNKMDENKKPSSKLQQLAQEENFALFVLTGMLGQLRFVAKVEPNEANRLVYYIKLTLARIKAEQNSRKVRRKLERKNKK